MNKYEQLIEHIINDEEDKARALFHQIVVEKSRDIYESLMDEEYAEEAVGGDQVESMVDEISMDETDGIGEGDDEDDGELDMGDMSSMDDSGDDHHDDVGGDENLEQKVMDLESELEALKAEFEQLMGGDDDMGDDMGMDDMGMDDMGDDMGGNGDEFKMMEESDDEEEMTEAKEEDDEKDDDDKVEESVYESKRQPLQKTAVDLMREYVEKISAPSNTEGQPAGTSTGGDHANVNTQSTVAGKNDMGGTAKNLVQGGTGADANPDGTSPKGKVDGKLVKNVQEIDVAKRNVNKPGGNKGAQNFYNTKAGAKKGEGQTTDGSVPVQKKSIEPGGN
jgi:hypothetical protein